MGNLRHPRTARRNPDARIAPWPTNGKTERAVRLRHGGRERRCGTPSQARTRALLVPDVAKRSPTRRKIFAQIGAIGLVRHGIRTPSHKFFYPAFNPFRRPISASSAAPRIASVARAPPVAEKNMRVFPMFFSWMLCMRVACGATGDAGRAAIAASGGSASRRRGEKKLRSGVDTLKNRD